jgi:hypothetical protein
VQARLEREEAEVEKENLKAMQLAEELSEQIKEDKLRQQLEIEQIQRSRRRGMSDATQVPMSPLSDTPTETFPNDIEWGGVIFNTVKLFHPRKGASICKTSMRGVVHGTQTALALCSRLNRYAMTFILLCH